MTEQPVCYARGIEDGGRGEPLESPGSVNVFIRKVTVNGFRASATDEVECSFPGRLSVLVGANNGGKTTVCEALYLAHPHVFPSLRRPTSAVLGRNPRTIDIEFAFGPDEEGPLGHALLSRFEDAPSWTRSLEVSMGKLRTAGLDRRDDAERTRLIYLPAHRHPLDDLAKDEATVIVELLRAEQERLTQGRSLADLRALASSLLDGLVKHRLIWGAPGGCAPCQRSSLGDAPVGIFGRGRSSRSNHGTGLRQSGPRLSAGVSSRLA